mgnify:CR=1 FL=1
MFLGKKGVILMSQINVESKPVVIELRLTVPECWSPFGTFLISMVIRRAAYEAFSVRLKHPHEPDERPLLRLWPVKRKPGTSGFSVSLTTPDCLLKPERARSSFIALIAMVSAYVNSIFWANDLPDFQMPCVTVDGTSIDLPRPLNVKGDDDGGK